MPHTKATHQCLRNANSFSVYSATPSLPRPSPHRLISLPNRRRERRCHMLSPSDINTKSIMKYQAPNTVHGDNETETRKHQVIDTSQKVPVLWVPVSPSLPPIIPAPTRVRHGCLLLYRRRGPKKRPSQGETNEMKPAVFPSPSPTPGSPVPSHQNRVIR